MKATAFFVKMTDDMVREINRPGSGGWDSEVGRRVQAAKSGLLLNEPERAEDFEAAAIVELETDEPSPAAADQVWVQLQNGHPELEDAFPVRGAWTSRRNVTNMTKFSRSMDVGDLVVFEDGTVFRCKSIGFEPVVADWATWSVLNCEPMTGFECA